MDDPEKLPPSERAKIVLQAFLRHSDVAGNTATYDPWPLAELEHAVETIYPKKTLSPSEAEKFREYAKKSTSLSKARRKAERKWSGSFTRRPMQQFFSAMRCLKLRTAIEAGDGGAVLEAVASCATNGLVMPAWLAEAFVMRYQRVATGECRDWSDDIAFGRALPKNANVKGVKRLKQEAPWAYEVAIRLLSEDPNRSIDRLFYEDVGSAIGKGHTVTFELISLHIEEGEGLWAPLDFVRTELRAGSEFGEALHKWAEKRNDDMYRQLGISSPAHE